MAPTPAQFNHLLNILAADKELLHGNFVAPLGAVRVPRRWAEIAVELNAMGGCHKSGEKWKECWIGLRGRARDAARKRRAYLHGTGGGPNVDIAGLGLSALHERVLELTGTKALWGTGCPNPLQIQLNHAVPAAPVAQADAQVAQEDPDDPLPLGAPGFDQIVGGAGAAVQENEVLHEQGAGAAGGLVAQNVAVGVQPKVDEVYFIEDNNAIIEFMNFVHQPDHEGGAGAAAIPVVNVKQEPAASDTEEQNVPVITLSDTPIKIKTSHTPPSASGYTPGWKKSKGGRLLEQDSASGLSSHSEGFFALPDVVKHEVIEEPDSLTPHRPAAHWLHSGSDPGLTNVNVKTQLHGIVLGNTIIMKSLIAAFSSLKKD